MRKWEGRDARRRMGVAIFCFGLYGVISFCCRDWGMKGMDRSGIGEYDEWDRKYGVICG